MIRQIRFIGFPYLILLVVVAGLSLIEAKSPRKPQPLPPLVKEALQQMDSDKMESYLFKLLTESRLSKFINFKSELTKEDLHQIKMTSQLRSREAPDAPLTPVIIVPSLVGSVLTATLNGFESPYIFCPSVWDTPFYLWLDDSETLILYAVCWYEHLTLQFNSATNTSSNTSGVFVDFVDYGGVTGVDYLNSERTLGVWNETIAVLQSLGYEIGKNLRAAPYDWRKGPIEYLQEDFPRLKKLVEETYEMNNNTPIAFASLSMGGPYFLSFLNNAVTQEWKDKYVHSFFSLDGAFGGSLESAMIMISPTYLKAGPLFSWYESLLQQMIQSFGSAAWMYPVPQFLGTDNALGVVSQEGNFSTKTWAQLMEAAGAPNASQYYTFLMQQGLTQFQAPGVKTYCIYGYGLPTLQKVVFQGDFSANYTASYADGDSTVLHQGLDICSYFQGQQKQPMIPFPVKGMIHGTSVHNKSVLKFLVQNLMA